MKKRCKKPVVLTIILLTSYAVFAYAAYNLAVLYSGYVRGQKKYTALADTYTVRTEEMDEPEEIMDTKGDAFSEKQDISDLNGDVTEQFEPGYIEDGECPITLNWAGLKAENPDIIGWIYLDAYPDKSYPVMQSYDNDFYLHRDFNKEYLFAGCLFADWENAADFSDPATIIYGHNMKDGSMFNCLKHYKEKEVYDASPYFWILTPNGDYRYHIYAAFDTMPKSAVYMLWDGDGQKFISWEQDIQMASAVSNNVFLTEQDHSVILSTCTPDSQHRTVVVGRCCSSIQPPRKSAPMQ